MCDSTCKSLCIKRTYPAPRFIEHERLCWHDYPFTLRIASLGVVLRYRVSKTTDFLNASDRMRAHTVFCWIMEGKRRVGAFHLNVYALERDICNEDFWQAMDGESALHSELATVLCEFWDDVAKELAAQGPILEFRWAWIASRYARSDLFAQAAPQIIDAACPDHSILIMKAFPLEHSGRAAADLSLRALDLRQRAMIRLHRRVFGVEPFPGPSGGDDGWLWRANLTRTDGISDPTVPRAASERF
jgi:hypothetical protein